VPFSVPALPSLPTESGEDDVWPAPPSPLSDVYTAPSTIGDMVTTDATHSTVTPVVRFTFTVKLDSQLLKRRRLQPATQSPDHNIITSPGTDLVCLSSTPPAVVIPDVVVCADTSSAVGKTCGNTVTRTKSLPPVQTSTAVVAMVDGRFEFSSQTLSGQFQQKQYEKEMGGEACGLTSTSCQTEELMVVESEILKPHDVTYACSCANQKPNSSLVVSRKSEDKQAPVTTSVTTVDTSQQLLCRCNKNCHSTPSHGVDSVDSVGCVDDDMFHQRRQLKCTNSHHDDGSYLRPLITRVYANNNPSHTEAVVKCSRTPADSDLTHMSWGEVLEEAQLMGIPLHAPEQRSSPCRATVVSCQSSCVDMSTVSPSRYRQSAAGQQLSQQVINQKISLSLNTTKTSFRDMFRFPRLFGRKKSANDGSVKRSRSMEAPSHRIQSRTLPVPPNTRQRDHQLELTDGGRKRQSRLSRYSASSCPPVSNSQLTISRATSVSSASRQTCGDYFVSSWTAGSSCSGSILAYHRQHADVQDKDVDDADDDDVVVDDVCVSPSMASFTSGSICSQSAPWRCLPSTPRSTVTSPGLCSSTWRCTNLTTDFVNCLSQLQHCGWYWGAIGFDEAEAKLLNRRDGSFLVRDSSDERYILSLSFRSLGTTHHTRIEHYKGSFSFCSQQPTHDSYSPATTIVEFIEASMTASRAGCTLYYLRPRSPDLPPAPVRLLYPVSRFHSMHTLRHLCKFAILRHVRLDMVDRLPLAPRLKEYLKHGRAT
jgi:suppressor of cytokine signaling 7